jgi:hypothetical protein
VRAPQPRLAQTLLLSLPMARSMFAFASAIAWSLACGNGLPAPETAKHPARAFIEVPYPPPAALVEVVPKEPDDCVWVDGHWIWRGRYYVWQRGGWLRPPPGARYATWQSVFSRDGRLLFARGAWYDESSRQIETPPLVAVARTPPNQITVETEAAR